MTMHRRRVATRRARPDGRAARGGARRGATVVGIGVALAALATSAAAAPPADLPAPPSGVPPAPGAPSAPDPSTVPDPSVTPPATAGPAPLVLTPTTHVSGRGSARVRLTCDASGTVRLTARRHGRERLLHSGHFSCAAGTTSVRFAVPTAFRRVVAGGGSVAVRVRTRAAGRTRRGTVVLTPAHATASRSRAIQNDTGYEGFIYCTARDAFDQQATVDVKPVYLRTSSNVVGEYWWRTWLLTWSDVTQSWSWTPSAHGWYSHILTLYGAGGVADTFYLNDGFQAWTVGYVEAWVQINGSWTNYSSWTSSAPGSSGPATYGPYCYFP